VAIIDLIVTFDTLELALFHRYENSLSFEAALGSFFSSRLQRAQYLSIGRSSGIDGGLQSFGTTSMLLPYRTVELLWSNGSGPNQAKRLLDYHVA
jgi:hypothetical protein